MKHRERSNRSAFPNARIWRNPQALTEETGRVAIVVRTKDRPLLLPRSVASIANQSYRNWHLYLVNDGGNREPVERIVQNNPLLQGMVSIIHSNISIGMEAASNVGIDKAQGSFLALLDDDDTWHVDFLKDTVDFLASPSHSHFAAVACRVVVVREKIEGDTIVEQSREDHPWNPTVEFGKLLCRNTLTNHSVLMRMEAVRETGDFNDQMPVLGDWDFWLRLLTIGDIGAIDRKLAFYHQRPNQSNEYGNTVLDGVARHVVQDTLYRNSLLRNAIKDPAAIGILSAVLRMMDEQQNALAMRMVQHDTKILQSIEEARRDIISQTNTNVINMLKGLLSTKTQVE